MRKSFVLYSAAMALILSSCHNKPAPASGFSNADSAANNGITPPSAAPGNATNSSLADTAYKSGDSIKTRSDSLRK